MTDEEWEKRSNQAILWSRQRSLDAKPVEYKAEDKKKEGNFKKKAALIIGGLSVIAIVSLPSTVKAVEEYNKASDAKSDILADIGEPVTDHTNYGEYNVEIGEKTFYYDSVYDMAEQVLNTNKQYDIHTRIYGYIKSLKPYDKSAYIDKLFAKMSEIIKSDPENYTDEELKISEYTTFNDYLSSLGLSEDEWYQRMDKIVSAYAKDSIYNEEIKKLLDDLNGDFGGR